MTDDELRIAIAEHLLPQRTNGIVEFQRFDSLETGFFQRVRFKDRTSPCYTGPIANYPEDLNAMHEAEKWLFENDLNAYCRYEAALRNNYREAISAKASQRALTFWRIITGREVGKIPKNLA